MFLERFSDCITARSYGNLHLLCTLCCLLDLRCTQSTVGIGLCNLRDRLELTLAVATVHDVSHCSGIMGVVFPTAIANGNNQWVVVEPENIALLLGVANQLHLRSHLESEMLSVPAQTNFATLVFLNKVSPISTRMYIINITFTRGLSLVSN